MNKAQRISVFLASLILLGVVYIAFQQAIAEMGDRGILVVSVLVTLSFTALLAEHFFTRPTDVVASGISVLLLISPIHPLLKETGVWYWILFAYGSVILVIALLALLLLDKGKAPTARVNIASHVLFRVATTIGSGRLVWFGVFLVVTLFYIDSQSSLFLVLLCYSAILLALDPEKDLSFLRIRRYKRADAVAEVFSVQAESVYLARTYPEAPTVRRFDLVGFSSLQVEAGKWISGVVLDTYQLNNQRWLRILTCDRFVEIDEKTSPPDHRDDSSVYLLVPSQEVYLLNSLVGVVCEGADIQNLRFEYAQRVSIEEGNLVEVSIRGHSVLYQVVQGITGIEKLESRDEAGAIIGEAVQLGIWNGETRAFDRFGWVPVINAPVIKARNIEMPTALAEEFRVGLVPGTNFPVFINLKTAITHHLAVLGVTGSGKSVFTRNLLRQISSNNTKIICVDFTNEYASKLQDLVAGTLLESSAAASMFKSIEAINEEMDKFPNQRDKKVIAANEAQLEKGFVDALKVFIGDDRKALLFELPDVSNSSGILEYTKWFFKSLFRLAREGAFAATNICVVLEEAHTVVPEWNFLGVDDKRSSAVVNSISQIALQGRKYGVGFVVVAQRTANVSKTVLTQCNSVVAFQQFDKTSAEFLSNHVNADYLKALTRLKNRHAIAVGKAFSGGAPIIFEVPQIDEPHV